MAFMSAIIAAFLVFGTSSGAATSTGDKGWGLDPNGGRAAAATADAGVQIDPEGKPRA